MTILVAGAAAIFDLICTADGLPGSSSVGVLGNSPGAARKFVPGGAALTIALTLRRLGSAVALFHPLPAYGAGSLVRRRLRRAGIDLAHVPAGPAATCILLQLPGGRLAWSGSAPLDAMEPPDSLLDAVSHLVIAPRWGDWTDRLRDAAVKRSIPISLIGEAPPARAATRWHCVVLDRRQREEAPALQADCLVVTSGADGATIHESGATRHVPARPVAAVDTTGAGDVFGATFLGLRLAGRSAEEAGREAAEAAAQCCLGWGAWAGLAEAPPASSAGVDARVRGALLGLACGDAFGMPNSFLRAPVWRHGMEPGPANSPYHAGYGAGRITDDTEQAIALTDALEDGFSPASVAARLNAWFVAVGGADSLAVGPSTRRALLAYQAGEDVMQIGRSGITNGGAMRIAPIGVFAGLARLPMPALVDLVETACLPTHHTTPAIAGAAAVAAAIAAGIAGAAWPDIMQAALAGARLGSERGNWVYAPDVAARIVQACDIAAGCADDAALIAAVSETIGAGEPTTESVPAALAIADYAGGDPRYAITLAGNLRGDTDTVAAMAGAICGAFAGDQALPADWGACVARTNTLDVSAWADRLRRCAHIQASVM
jgi:ADP-ribosylglycohydrolase/sugar/nucleoside kinase (ribokinase family)